jgi:hypothetical protein
LPLTSDNATSRTCWPILLVNSTSFCSASLANARGQRPRDPTSQLT